MQATAFTKSRLADGKTLRVQGKLSAGKKTGKWVYRDEKGIMCMEANYRNDKAVSCTAYDEQGRLDEKNECIIEKPADFKGGLDGWRHYLEKKLKYPDFARQTNTQGLVKIQFIVNLDGSVSDLKVLESPGESLSNEALRIISSAKWEPAIQYNRKVIYRHIQAITFRLE